MATKVDSSVPDVSSLGIKVDGDMALQVIEGSGSSDDDEDDDGDGCETTITNLSHIPHDLVPSTSSRSYGTVQVTNSENVQFGNNTYFHGNVVIKQIIQTNKSGTENSSYVKTDDETQPANKYSPNTKDIADTKFHIRTWHKIIFSTLCIVIIGVVCILVFLLRNQSTQEDNSVPPTSNDNIGNNDNNSTDPLFIAPGILRIVERQEWLAQPPNEELDKLKLPAPWVIIAHSATEPCFSQSGCVLGVRLIQSYHVDSRHWADIGYNFLVGGDGSAYVGRGWNYVGAHTKYYNKYSIGIAFIGTFTKESPPARQVEACRRLIDLGVKEGKIAKDYKLLAHRQLMSTESPGETVYQIIKTWPHFYNHNDITKIIPK